MTHIFYVTFCPRYFLYSFVYIFKNMGWQDDNNTPPKSVEPGDWYALFRYWISLVFINITNSYSIYSTKDNGPCGVWVRWINQSLFVWWSMHYSDVIMNPMASQNTSLTIVYSTVYSGTDQRIHQRSASLVTGEFPAQMASNAENVSISWRHHGLKS